ncbi:MAG TPA: nucleosidase [Flavobacteriales bacterium]|jgi:adenosylhomocysteine nucleosidase|nr:nucleosidase [Flavobacteriales bacterium]
MSMMIALKDVLVVMALQIEAGELIKNKDINLIFCGIGKVNATYELTKKLKDFRPALVLNLGTAGSSKFPRNKLVAAHRFIQRDMDVTGLGFEKHRTPFDPTPTVIEHKSFFPELQNGLCGSGDRFETLDGHVAEIIDMEAYALAKVCWKEGIDFACVKYISDGGDSNAAADWKDSIKKISSEFDVFLREKFE